MQWLNSLKKLNSKLARWKLRLEEFENDATRRSLQKSKKDCWRCPAQNKKINVVHTQSVQI